MDLSIVIPVYKSARILPELVDVINRVIPSNVLFELILVNDCSPDDSWKVICDLAEINPNLIGLNLRKNAGQHNAIMAGLREASGSIIVTMDDDFQHNPIYILDFISAIERGADCCYSRFHKMKQKTWKVLGSRFNGLIANFLLDKPRDLYLSSYKAISKEIRDMIIAYNGPYPYVDGLILLHTDNIVVIDIEHQERLIGQGNYSFLKSLALWAMMSTGFSVKPLRLATFLGIGIAFCAFVIALLLIIYKLAFDVNIQGWTSLSTMVLFMGGVQLIFLGVIGEYIGRSYLTVNHNPQVVIKEKTTRNHGRI
ncbi:MAG: glycosyltransferase family 2 protein [Chlorobium sp.]|nr:glycosyltransferase family 2 protein [Chlorobium sp.]